MNKIKSGVIAVSTFSSIFGALTIFNNPNQDLNQKGQKQEVEKQLEENTFTNNRGSSSSYSSSSQSAAPRSDVINPVDPDGLKASFGLKMLDAFKTLGEQKWKQTYVQPIFIRKNDQRIDFVIQRLKNVGGFKIAKQLKGEEIKLFYHQLLPILRGKYLAADFKYLGKDEWIKRYVASSEHENNFLNSKLDESLEDIQKDVLSAWQGIKWELWIKEFYKRELLWKIENETLEDAKAFINYLHPFNPVNMWLRWKKNYYLNDAIRVWSESYLYGSYDQKQINEWLNKIASQSLNKDKQIAYIKMHNFLAKRKWNKYKLYGGLADHVK